MSPLKVWATCALSALALTGFSLTIDGSAFALGQRATPFAAQQTSVAVPPLPDQRSADAGMNTNLKKHAANDSEILRRICRVTAYCDRGVTASGTQAGVGQCAAPADIPFGSTVHIPSLGQTFVVTDRTHRRFRRSTVDIFIPSRNDCLEFGVSYLEVEVTLPEE